MHNAEQDEAKAEIKTVGRNINKLRYANDTTLMVESKEEQRSLLMKVKEECESWLKSQHSKMNIMEPGPITSGQMDGETMKTVTYLFLGTQKLLHMVTAAMKLRDTCSFEETP